MNPDLLQTWYFVSDSLTLQLWRDGREAERGVASTKGSVNLNDYIGAEVGFNLDKEANTIALIFREMIHILALDDRETLMKWQVSSGGLLCKSKIAQTSQNLYSITS